MKRVNWFLLVCFVFTWLMPINSFSQIMVVGYVPMEGDYLPNINDSTLKKLTHLNIAFVNPDSTGKLILPLYFDSIIQQAHANKVKVLMSIGGGSFLPYYANLLKEENRKPFVEKLVQVALEHKLDGIDVDIEGDNIDKNYDAFVGALHTALKPSGKLLTAALATWNAQLISSSVLKKFDFINIMSYDQTGPWRPTEPGPHSTFKKAEEDLHYWTVSRGFPKKKINLGLPFYGYCFGTQYGESLFYKNIVETFPDAEQQDMVVPATGGIIYYNGLTTIKKKTNLAIKNSGGVMIWQILQDAEGEKSLLTAIDEIIKDATKKNK